MLPLLPVEVITPENVGLLFFLLRPACREHASDFDDLYSYIINNYVAQNARFQKQIWCVCGQAIRTNNAAESSHATLNTFVRVSGAVSLDVFLFAIERQMRNASREIQAGCPSHTRAIYARRNGLLATELSDLLVGKQGILKYLARCSEIVRVKNLNDIRRFMDRKGGEGDDPFDREWALRSREVLLRAATSLYETLCPTNPNPTASIVSTVASWTFQPVSFEGDVRRVLDDDSTLPLAAAAPRKSFDVLRARLFGQNSDSDEVEWLGFERTPRRDPLQRTPTAYEGDSYRLVIVDNCGCL